MGKDIGCLIFIMSEHHKAKKGGIPLLKLALGAALAAGAGYYVTHKEEVDKEAKKRIDRLAKMFRESRPEIERKVKKAWGQVSKHAIVTYLDLRGQLLHLMEEENLKKSGKMLREQYEKIVDEVIKRARRSGVLTPQVEERLAEIFKLDWKDIQRTVMKLMARGLQKTAAMVRTATVSHKVRAVKKTVQKTAKKTKDVKGPAKRVSKRPQGGKT